MYLDLFGIIYSRFTIHKYIFLLYRFLMYLFPASYCIMGYSTNPPERTPQPEILALLMNNLVTSFLRLYENPIFLGSSYVRVGLVEQLTKTPPMDVVPGSTLSTFKEAMTDADLSLEASRTVSSEEGGSSSSTCL